jgi:hypothetical protein
MTPDFFDRRFLYLPKSVDAFDNLCYHLKIKLDYRSSKEEVCGYSDQS